MSTFEYCFGVCLYVSCCFHDSSGDDIPSEPLKVTELTVETSFSEFNVSRGYVGVAFPHFMKKWKNFDLSSPQTINLARALKHSAIRLYGTPILNQNDISQYNKDKELWKSNDYDDSWKNEKIEDPKNLILTMEHWTKAVEFLNKVGWKLMMDFTALIHRNGRWVSRYAEALLDLATKNKIPIPEFQLGNQPNLYDPRLKINASTVVRDFTDMRKLLKKNFPFYSASKVIGPDVTKFSAKSSKKNNFFEEFLRAGGCDHVDEISFHHYYFKNDALESDFINSELLDMYITVVETGKNMMRKYNCHKPLRLTEAASSSGGGTKDLSDSFIAGFSWMDKLGMSALLGITRVFRHSLFGNHYSLVDYDLNPSPDYYLTLVFSKFVEGPVFRIKSKLPNHIRAYANCAKEYIPGSLVIYLMNLKDVNVILNFTEYSNHTVLVYLFTAFNGSLTTKKTVLNDEQLEIKGNNIPILKEARYSGDAVTIPSLSYAFVVVTGADIPLCINYFREHRSSETTTEETTTSETTMSAETHWITTILKEPSASTETVSTSIREFYDFVHTTTKILTSEPDIVNFTNLLNSSENQKTTSTSNSIIKYNVSTETVNHNNTKDSEKTTEVTLSSISTEGSSDVTRTTILLEEPTVSTEAYFTSPAVDHDTAPMTTEILTPEPEIINFTTLQKTSEEQTMTSTFNSIIKYNISTETLSHKNTKNSDKTPEVTLSSISTKRSSETTRTTNLLEKPTANTGAVPTFPREHYDTAQMTTKFITSEPEKLNFTTPPKTTANQAMTSTPSSIIKYNVSTETVNHNNTKDSEKTTEVTLSSISTEGSSDVTRTTILLEEPTVSTEAYFTSPAVDHDTAPMTTEILTPEPEIINFTTLQKTSEEQTMTSTFNSIIKYNISTETLSHKNTKNSDKTPEVTLSSISTKRSSETTRTTNLLEKPTANTGAVPTFPREHYDTAQMTTKFITSEPEKLNFTTPPKTTANQAMTSTPSSIIKYDVTTNTLNPKNTKKSVKTPKFIRSSISTKWSSETTPTATLLKEPTVSTSLTEGYDSTHTTTEIMTPEPEVTDLTTTEKPLKVQTMTSTFNLIVKYNVSTKTQTHANTRQSDTTPGVTLSSFSTQLPSEAGLKGTIVTSNKTSLVIFPTIFRKVSNHKQTIPPCSQSALQNQPFAKCFVLCFAFLLLRWVFLTA